MFFHVFPECALELYNVQLENWESTISAGDWALSFPELVAGKICRKPYTPTIPYNPILG
jgi:hypothetical protein